MCRGRSTTPSPFSPSLLLLLTISLSPSLLLQYMNPTDWFMSVLKEKGDDLVLAWQKQASAGGGSFLVGTPTWRAGCQPQTRCQEHTSN